MAPKIISVIGATGSQGKSIIAAFANNPSYRIRAVVRNPSSEGAKAVAAQGIEVVQADLNDLASLKAAFAGSAIIYGVTNFFEPFAAHGPTKAVEIEVQQGKNLATAAAATPTLEHYIWSTLPNGRAASGGKYAVPHFEGKNEIDAFIRANKALLAKTTFLWITFYGNNFVYPMFTPYYIPSAGKYVQFANYSEDLRITTIGDVSVNMGKFVKAAVEQPEKTLNGVIVLASVETLTAGEFLKTLERVKGVKTQFVRVSGKDFRDLWPMWADEMGLMMEFWDEYRDHWSAPAEYKLVTKEDLGITGLQSLAEGLKSYEL